MRDFSKREDNASSSVFLLATDWDGSSIDQERVCQVTGDSRSSQLLMFVRPERGTHPEEKARLTSGTAVETRTAPQ